jgi:hypothetical protein
MQKIRTQHTENSQKQHNHAHHERNKGNEKQSGIGKISEEDMLIKALRRGGRGLSLERWLIHKSSGCDPVDGKEEQEKEKGCTATEKRRMH